MSADKPQPKQQEPIKAEVQTIKNNNTPPTAPAQQIDPKSIQNLNNVVIDLTNLSKLCQNKLIEYSDITSTFKNISQISNNLAVAISIFLKEKGELDESKFKLTQ